MVRSTSGATRYTTTLTNGRVEATADTVKGGAGSLDGFRPHELLEAAVASCMNISVRLRADDLGCSPVEVATEVSLDRSQPARATFRCRVQVYGSVSDETRAFLEQAAFDCAVGQTLRREIVLLRDGDDRTDAATAASGGPPTPAAAKAVRWNAADYHANASAQSAWGREVHGALALRPDDILIDLGCGDGRLTAELADRVPAGRVCGLDADPDMTAFARRAHARPNLRFVEGDLRTFSVPERANWIVSTASLHWVPEHEAVLRRCREHLTAGGRILFQMGGRGNCAEILAMAAEVAAEPPWSFHLQPFASPWSFYGPEDYEAFLARTGFRRLRAELRAKDMVHDGPEAMRGWIRTTWMPILQRLPEPLRADFVAALAARYLEQRPPDAQGRTHVAVVRLEVEAEAI